MRAEHTPIFHVNDTLAGFQTGLRQIRANCPELSYFEGQETEGYVMSIGRTGPYDAKADANRYEGVDFVLIEQVGRLAVGVRWAGLDDLMPALLQSIAEFYPESQEKREEYLGEAKRKLSPPAEPGGPIEKGSVRRQSAPMPDGLTDTDKTIWHEYDNGADLLATIDTGVFGMSIQVP